MTKTIANTCCRATLCSLVWILITLAFGSCSSRNLREERIFQALLREEKKLPRSDFAVGSRCYRLEIPRGRTLPRLSQQECDGSNPHLIMDLARLLPGELRSVRGVRVSPDGSLIAVLAATKSGSELIIAKLSEQKDHESIAQAVYRTAAPFEFEWLADSKRIALIRRDQVGGSRFTVLNFQSYQETLMAEVSGGAEYLHLELTASGRYLLLARRGLFSELWQAYSTTAIDAAPIQIGSGEGKALACDTARDLVFAEDVSAGEARVIIRSMGSGKERSFELPANSQLERINCFSNTALLTLQDGWGQQVYYVDTERSILNELALPHLWNKVPPSQRFESQIARVSSEGPGQPPQDFLVDLSSGSISAYGDRVPARRELEIRKELIRSSGDTLIPVTIIIPTGRDGARAAPVLLHTYGAYGVAVATDYDPALLPLWDHGFGYAVANIPGGGGRGVAWHQRATGRDKSDGIEHLTAVAKALRNRSEIDPALVFGYGRSAGALILLSAASKTQDLFKGVILDAPIMRSPVQLGSAEPLLARELQEWGQNTKPFDMLVLSQSLRPPSFFLSFSERDDTISVAEIIEWLAVQNKLYSGDIDMAVHPMLSSTHQGADFSEEESRLQAKQIEFMLRLAHK